MRAFRAVLFLFFTLPLFAQMGNTVSGSITTSTGSRAAGIAVRLVDLRRSTVTDAKGEYVFANVPPGRHIIQADSPRFGTAITSIDVTGATTTNLRLDIPVHSEAIVVSASVDPRAASEVAQPVDKLSGQALDARQQPTLGETLAQQPGVSSTGFVPGASRPIIRGFGGDRIRILEDGIGVGDASNVSQDHNVSVDPINAQSIEIVRGPSTLLYGSNAVGGVVNVIDDRVPMARINAPITGTIDVRGTTNAGERDGHLSLSGGKGAFAWQGGLSKRTTNDYDTPIGKLFNSDIDATTGSLGASLVGDRGFLGLSYNGYATDYGVSDAGPGNPAEEVVRIDMRQRRWDLKSELLSSGPISATRFRVGRTDYSHFEKVNGEPEAQFLNKFTEARMESTHRELGLLHGAFGIQYSNRDFRVESEESLLPPTVTKNMAAFLFEELGHGTLRWQFGGRYENQKIDVESDELPDRTLNGLSGSIAAVYVPNADYTASVSLSHSARLPVAEELYFNGAHEATFQFEIGDPTLDNETGNGIDISLRKRTGPVTGELSLFAQRFNGYIYQNPTDEFEDGFRVFEFTQRDANFRGAEAHVDISLMHAEPRHLSLELSADAVRATLANGGGPLPFIPPYRYGAGLRFDTQSIFALAEVRRAAAQNHVAAFETTTPGYTMINAALGYRFFTANVIHDVMVRGTNLGNKLAYNHVNPIKDAVPLPGRDLTVSYRLTF